MTIYLAIDAAASAPLPNGLIRGIAETSADLVAQGFSASTYTGQRRPSIDETDSTVWDNDCVPGWYYVGGAVQRQPPVSQLSQLRSAISAFQAQIVEWQDNLNARGVGQPPAKVTQGHNRLYSGLAATYITCRDAGNPLTSRIAFAQLMRYGALDITNVDGFYLQDTGTFDNPPIRGESGDWFAWVDITANPVARVNLTSSVRVPGAVAESVNLLGNWQAEITA